MGADDGLASERRNQRIGFCIPGGIPVQDWWEILPPTVEPARGIGVREHGRRRGQRDAHARCRRRRVEGCVARKAGHHPYRVRTGHQEGVLEVGAREHRDVAPRNACADLLEQRYQAQGDIAQSTIPREHELAPALAPGRRDCTLECRAPHAIAEDAAPALDVETSAGTEGHEGFDVEAGPQAWRGCRSAPDAGAMRDAGRAHGGPGL